MCVILGFCFAMLFNSLAYLIFLPVAVAGYYLLPEKFRVGWLLVSSCVFYMAYKPVYILVLGALIAIDFFAGLCIANAAPRRAKAYLLISIAATCGVLFIFKYYFFVATNAATLAGRLGHGFIPHPFSMPLPIGLSFHTFQSLAYVIEVYRGNQRPERNPLVYATYVMFFPQLVSGPIERPGNMLHQFRERHRFEPARAAEGMKRIALGLYKKAVIADRLGPLVNQIIDSPSKYGGFDLTLGVIAFTYQIYCDFSGYSDIAVGSAQLLGFRLTENFNDPFASGSISEFWRRWHISLSQWFRDYVYIPLGGDRASSLKFARNILVTFALSGLWHGASWTYVVWGVVNGVYLLAGRFTRPLRDRMAETLGLRRDHPLRAACGILLTFCFTCLAFVIFRSRTLSQATYILAHMFHQWPSLARIRDDIASSTDWMIALPAIALLETIQLARRRPALTGLWTAVPSPVRMTSYLAFSVAVLFFGVFLNEGTFLYFQF